MIFGSRNGLSTPSYGGKYGMWQYTSSGKTGGITGNTDMDLAFKDYPNIMRANGLNGFSKGAAESTDNVKSGAFPPRPVRGALQYTLVFVCVFKSSVGEKIGYLLYL